MRAGGCPVVVDQWQSTGRALAAQARCPGFDSRRLPAFPLLFTFLKFSESEVSALL